MNFLCRFTGLSLRDKVRSLDIQKELRIEPQLAEVLRHLIRMRPGCWTFFGLDAIMLISILKGIIRAF